MTKTSKNAKTPSVQKKGGGALTQAHALNQLTLHIVDRVREVETCIRHGVVGLESNSEGFKRLNWNCEKKIEISLYTYTVRLGPWRFQNVELKL